MADWRQDVIRAVGGKPSPGTLAFLQGWGTKEGGHIHNTARFNWLNRIDTRYPSAGTSVKGIAAYPNYQTGVARTAALIQEGYPAIYNSLRSGQVSFQNPNVQGDLNRWLTGKRTPGMSPYVSKVAELSGMPAPTGAGAATPPSAAARPVGAAAPVAQAPQMPQTRFAPNLQNMMGLLGSLRSRREARQEDRPAPPLGNMIGQIMAMRQTVPQPQPPVVADSPADRPGAPPVQPGGKKTPVASGGFLQAPAAGSYAPSPHAGNETSGLGWGATGPRDIMAAPGTKVGAPEDGVIIRHGSAQGGESLYFQGASGKTYWMGHVERSLPPGTRVRRGQVITYISGQHDNPHLHIDSH